MKIGMGRFVCLSEIHLENGAGSWQCKNCHELVVQDFAWVTTQDEYYSLLNHFADIEVGDYAKTVLLMKSLTLGSS